MLDIEYKGGNAVIFATKNTTVVVDPVRSVFGQPDLALKNVVEVATEARFATNSGDVALRIEGPGEYEIGDFILRGVAAKRHIDAEGPLVGTIYRLEVGDFRVAVLGNIDGKLSEDQLEAIGVVDIMVLPVGGGGYTLDATSAATIVRQIEPKVVIPVHYADAALTYEVPQDELATFTKELDAEVASDVGTKLRFKNAAALPAQRTVMPVTRS